MLHCGKPVAAFDCLVEAVQVFRTNPRLWLRLAECCIMTNREVIMDLVAFVKNCMTFLVFLDFLIEDWF